LNLILTFKFSFVTNITEIVVCFVFIGFTENGVSKGLKKNASLENEYTWIFGDFLKKILVQLPFLLVVAS